MTNTHAVPHQGPPDRGPPDQGPPHQGPPDQMEPGLDMALRDRAVQRPGFPAVFM